jgi:uncharacterized protein
MREMLRINLATQTSVFKTIRYNTDSLVQMMKENKTVNIDGYEMSWPLYEQSSTIDLVNHPLEFTGKTLLARISRKEADVGQSFQRLHEHLNNCETVLAMEEPFWKEIKSYYPVAQNLAHVTWAWLQK